LVSVAGQDTDAGRTAVTLRLVTAVGDVVLDRRFVIERADCSSAGSLLEAVLERFLAELPRPLGAGPPLVQAVSSSLEIELGLSGAVLPLDWSAELGLRAAVGSTRHQLVGGALVRLDGPQDLGPGHVVSTTALLSVGYRLRGDAWTLRFELRAGGAWLYGQGFDANAQQWVVWGEAASALLFRVGPLLVGPEVGGSPLEAKVVSPGLDGSAQLPRLRLGLHLALPVVQ
jgi:hypothetical protein